MALYLQETYVNQATFLTSLASFASDNGWTVDTLTSSELQITKNGASLRLRNYSSSGFYPTGIIDGNESYSTYIHKDYVAGDIVRFFSCGNSIYIIQATDGHVLGFMNLGAADKIGDWTGGVILNGNTTNSNSSFRFLQDAMYAGGSFLYKQGAWSNYTNSKIEGALWGSIGSDPLLGEPNIFNMAIVPIPVLICMFNADTNYMHPISYAPGVYRVSPGALYSAGDYLTIGGDTYVVGATMSLLFKVSA